MVVAAVMVLAACGGDDDDGGGQATAGGKPEVTDLTLGTLPIVDVAPIQIALDDGLFEKEGLKVKTEVMQGGAAAIPGLVSGELSVAFGAWPSFFQASTQGIELRAIANGVRAQPNFTLILAKKGSPLEGKPSDLAGRTVAVNTLNNLGELAVRSTLKQAGGDPAAVKLLEVPFPEMGAALERGDVDAIWAVEPFATLAKQQGAVVVADSYTGPLENFPVAGYQVTKQFADDNPNTVAAFQRAITAASETARSNPDRVRQLLPTSAKVPAAAAEEVALPEYLASIDQAQFQRVVDYLNEFGIMKEKIQAGDLVVAPPS